ncbi:hypothetical protein BIY24_08640 [Halobacteriovorax marinus]|uniref:bifunctional metallophosphatase/5'-nucleotidase n=1 Tax=Halobacteriovorax marinus TaxID=97084 RepID=UPI000BC33D58|nr:metallophosphoesterase [Halobacteriovorax marinus]ATH08016.1 hypothetical protein BIY24_08640 [Halobacteriovorax marinus]
MKSILLFAISFLQINSFAAVVQILHTNDLHSYYDHTIIDPTRGSYAALKAKMDELEALAAREGVSTLRFDAGDFLDGNLYYMADRGRRGFRMMERMGYDAIAVGNHDWLMGGSELNQMLEEQPPTFHYLGANFKAVNPLFTSIKKHIRPYTSFNVDGVTIGVMGLTTNEIAYKWRFTGGDIDAPAKVGDKLSTQMKKKGNDFVIALSHVGLSGDRKIIKKSSDIDLLIGGHSHTAIMQPLMVRNANGNFRPIVQTGAHVRFLGQMKLELIKGKPLKILDYKLIPIYSGETRDASVDQFVSDSREMLNSEYGEDYLAEILGYTRIKLRNSESILTPWTRLISDAVKDAVDADISFHSPMFGGASLPVGKVTREMVFNSYPRVFDLDDKYGWAIYKVDIHGVILKSLIRLILKGQFPVTFSGVTFDLIDDRNEIIDINTSVIPRSEADDESNPLGLIGQFLGIDRDFDVVNIRVHGEPILPHRQYRVSMPEGIVVGGLGMTGSVRYLLRRISKTDMTMWEAISKKVQEVGIIDYSYGIGNDFYRNSVLKVPRKKEKVLIPYRAIDL